MTIESLFRYRARLNTEIPPNAEVPEGFAFGLVLIFIV